MRKFLIKENLLVSENHTWELTVRNTSSDLWHFPNFLRDAKINSQGCFGSFQDSNFDQIFTCISKLFDSPLCCFCRKQGTSLYIPDTN